MVILLFLAYSKEDLSIGVKWATVVSHDSSAIEKTSYGFVVHGPASLSQSSLSDCVIS